MIIIDYRAIARAMLLIECDKVEVLLGRKTAFKEMYRTYEAEKRDGSLSND